tara:strand:- start:266 stop:406 length:141 start_codon:yes stop_codon:yes gene_type:complete
LIGCIEFSEKVGGAFVTELNASTVFVGGGAGGVGCGVPIEEEIRHF